MSAPLGEIDARDMADADALKQVAALCRPVVIRGLCVDWPVARAAAESAQACASHLDGFDAGLSAEAFVGTASLGGRYHYGDDLEGFNFLREGMTVKEALRRIVANAAVPGGPTVYLGSLPGEHYFPGFAEANPNPVLPGTVMPRIWLGNASTIACHYDMFDNLACVVAGHRRFTLFPPDAIGDLYVGPVDHTMAGQPVALAVGAAVDDARYPRFGAARERALVVDLAPGDALYLPKLWWHQVEATDPFNLLVNYWWDGFSAGPDAPYATMLLAMIAIAERPEAERAAWRAFFDHYVFRPGGGHPLAHLPEEKRGILGPLGRGNYGRIRTLVMRLLRGG
ncbi:MAG: cupin-like domain-containing protein [Sphingobium sp.]|nr:MAG: cupin-like domain-containing protein [Sphingobium sp.]